MVKGSPGVRTGAQPSRDGRGLRLASESGDLDALRAQIAGGALVNDVGKGSWTALHRATQRGYVDIVNELLSNGADISATTHNGRYTALHIACREGHHEIARTLVNQGANPRGADAAGMTPVHMVAQSNRGLADDREHLIKALVKAGADPNDQFTRSGGVASARLLPEAAVGNVRWAPPSPSLASLAPSPRGGEATAAAVRERYRQHVSGVQRCDPPRWRTKTGTECAQYAYTVRGYLFLHADTWRSTGPGRCAPDEGVWAWQVDVGGGWLRGKQPTVAGAAHPGQLITRGAQPGPDER